MSSMRQLHQKRHVEELTFRTDFVFNSGTKGQVLRGFSTGLSNSMAFNRSPKVARKMQSVLTNQCKRRPRVCPEQSLNMQRCRCLHVCSADFGALKSYFGTEDLFVGLDHLLDWALFLSGESDGCPAELPQHFTFVFSSPLFHICLLFSFQLH